MSSMDDNKCDDLEFLSILSSMSEINKTKKVRSKSQKLIHLFEDYTISEKDFYPPEDNRVLQSGVEDIVNGDNFMDYTKEYFKYCSSEGVYENDI